MKSAQEWLYRAEFDIAARSGILRSEFARIIEEVQRDASTTKTHFLETALDIAYLAGSFCYHSGDSRADIDSFIAWANEFETQKLTDPDGNETYFGQEYLSAIEQFAKEKMNK